MERGVEAHVLSIAGVDPSGGAGLLADIKTISALGAYATGVVAALTAQNTRAVTEVFAVPASFVAQQIDTLFEDVGIDAVKIGMLGDAAVIEAVCDRLRFWKPRWIVLDPVMVAKSGDRLIESQAVKTLLERLLPMTDVITPNLPEASVLLGRSIVQESEMLEAAQALQRLTQGKAVLLKGGHLASQDCRDVLLAQDGPHWFTAQRVYTKNTHGTGCALSSAIATGLAQGLDVVSAVSQAKAYITSAIQAADWLHVGGGHGPVHHFATVWPRSEPATRKDA